MSNRADRRGQVKFHKKTFKNPLTYDRNRGQLVYVAVATTTSSTDIEAVKPVDLVVHLVFQQEFYKKAGLNRQTGQKNED